VYKNWLGNIWVCYVHRTIVTSHLDIKHDCNTMHTMCVSHRSLSSLDPPVQQPSTSGLVTLQPELRQNKKVINVKMANVIKRSSMHLFPNTAASLDATLATAGSDHSASTRSSGSLGRRQQHRKTSFLLVKRWLYRQANTGRCLCVRLHQA
jgi:hypothetical protein